MDVIVDGERNFSITGEPQTLLDVMAAARIFLQEKQRVVVKLTLDGEIVTLDQIDAVAQRALTGIKVIDICSDSIKHLVEQSLSELQLVLPDLPQACRDLAQLFQGDDPESGFEPFHRLADIWRHVKIRETEIAHAMDIDIESMLVNETPVHMLHGELNQYLSEAAEAIEAGDCILLGDLLEYELAPRAEAEAVIVGLLRDRMAQSTN